MNLKKIALQSLFIPLLGLSIGVHAAEAKVDKKAETKVEAKADEKQTAEQIKEMEKQIAIEAAAKKEATKKELAAKLTKFKNRGLVGERANGYIAPVRPRWDVNELVQKINQGRLKHYAKIAADSGYSVIQIEVIAGEKSRKNAKVGHYIENERVWEKKK